MDALFWQRLHGGATHFPIVLVMMSVALDFIARRSRDEGLRRGLHAAAFGSVALGILGGSGAIVSGLFMTGGRALGSGLEQRHHLFVWPAFGLCVAMVTWRLACRGIFSHRFFTVYLSGLSLASVLMLGGG